MNAAGSATESTVAVVGGGLSGLATAYAILQRTRDRKAPVRVVVLEADTIAGGKVRTIRDGDWVCEWGPNGFLDKEPLTRELCASLRLDAELEPATDAAERRYLYRRNQLLEVSMHPAKFLRSPILSWRGKLRLMAEPFVRTRRDTDDESIASFATRRIGVEGLRMLVDPMQTGIYAGDPERLSVASTFPRVVEVEREYGSLIRGMIRLQRERKRSGGPAVSAGPSGRLTSITGGLQRLVDRIGEELGASLRCGVEVTEVAREGDRWVLRGPRLRDLDADRVVLACPAPRAAAMIKGVDADLGRELAGIEYAPVAVVCLGFARTQVRRALDGFGFLAPRSEGLRLLGSLWTSTLFSNRAPDGHVLTRTIVGGARDAAALELDDAAIVDAIRAEIGGVLGIEGPPAFSRVFRHLDAIPQYTIGHADRLARIDARCAAHPGLTITGNAYRGVGINDCVRNAAPAAEQALAGL